MFIWVLYKSINNCRLMRFPADNLLCHYKYEFFFTIANVYKNKSYFETVFFNCYSGVFIRKFFFYFSLLLRLTRFLLLFNGFRKILRDFVNMNSINLLNRKYLLYVNVQENYNVFQYKQFWLDFFF